MIDKSKPADVRLTRQQKAVLKVVQAQPGLTAVQVAEKIGARPYYAYHALDALQRFRWITSDAIPGRSSYLTSWYPKDHGDE